MVICLERGADLHMAQLMLLPLNVSDFSKIQIGFNFLVPGNPGSPRQRVIKRVCRNKNAVLTNDFNYTNCILVKLVFHLSTAFSPVKPPVKFYHFTTTYIMHL